MPSPELLSALIVLALLAIASLWQLRGLRRQVARMRADQTALLARLETEEEASEPTSVPPEFAPLERGQTELLERVTALDGRLISQDQRLGHHETALESFAGMLEDQHALLELIDARTRSLASQAEARPVGAPVSGPTELPSAERIVRTYLSEEGYADLEFGDGETTPDGWRVPVRGLKGQDLRAGWVVVRAGQVVAASLEVPTSLFP